mmetsp:Transcript_7708/g.11445  ORF Transcript_7708/g.11445 Transcript_7708/m.11445 type:complete len:333 (-) Transcript_7708:41-1039(-)
MVVDKTYYNILGVSPDVDKKAIKKAYRKKALKFHPDRAPDDKKEEYENKFKEVSEAYQVLSDDKQRKLYDQYGKDGMKYGGAPPRGQPGGGAAFQGFSSNGSSFQFMDPQDVFNKMGGFGGFGGFSSMFGDDRSHHGRTSGGGDDMFGFPSFGFPSGSATGSFQQNQPKQTYQHETFVSLKDLYTCKQKKIRMNLNGKQKQFTFELRPGTKDGTKVTFQGDTPNDPNVQFVVKVKKESDYEKDRYDIIYTKKIKLGQALLGTNVQIPLLNGKYYSINLNNTVITPKYRYKIQGEGLPAPGGKPRGNMIVKFDIQFPTYLNADQKTAIATMDL